MHRGVACLFVLGPLACGPTELDRLAPGPEVQSILLAFEEADGVRVIATGADHLLSEVSPPADQSIRLTALLYSARLEALGIEPGNVLPPDSDQPSRGLPVARATWVADVRADTDVAWQEVDSLSPELAAFRLPALDRAKCMDAGGCFLDAVEREEDLRCTLPCPEPNRPMPPTPPVATVTPIHTPCPSGWSARALDEEIEICEPDDLPAHAACTGAEAQFFGEASCRPIGNPCPAGTWPEALPAGAYFVDPNAVAGGNGSMAMPFDQLQTAIDQVPAGSVLALAKGGHTGPLVITKDVSLIGACTAESWIEGSISNEPAIRVTSGVVALFALEIRGGDWTIDMVGPQTEVDVRDVLIIGGAQGGILATQGLLTANHAFVRGTAAVGIRAQSGALAELADVGVEGTTDIGIIVHEARANLRRVMVAGIGPPTIDGGVGLLFEVSALGDLEDILIDGRTGVALRVAETSSVSARGVALRDIHAAQSSAVGLSIIDHSQLTVERLSMRGVAGWGVILQGAATLDLERGYLLAPRANPRAATTGIHIEDSVLRASRLALIDATLRAVQINRSTVNMNDVVIQGVTPSASDTGIGLELRQDAVFDGQRIAMSEVEGIGVRVVERSMATLGDLRLRAVRFIEMGGTGFGMAVSEQSKLSAQRVEVTDIDSVALQVSTFGSAEVSDLIVRIPDGNENSTLVVDEGSLRLSRAEVHDAGDHAFVSRMTGQAAIEDLRVLRAARVGVLATRSSSVSIVRFSAEDCGCRGIGANDKSSLSAIDVRVERIQGHGLAQTQCSDIGGFTTTLDASASLYRFEILDGEGAGLLLAGSRPAQEVVADEGLVSENRVGMSITSDRLDLAADLRRVVVQDNEVNVERH